MKSYFKKYGTKSKKAVDRIVFLEKKVERLESKKFERPRMSTDIGDTSELSQSAKAQRTYRRRMKKKGYCILYTYVPKGNASEFKDIVRWLKPDGNGSNEHRVGMVVNMMKAMENENQT